MAAIYSEWEEGAAEDRYSLKKAPQLLLLLLSLKYFQTVYLSTQSLSNMKTASFAQV